MNDPETAIQDPSAVAPDQLERIAVSLGIPREAFILSDLAEDGMLHVFDDTVEMIRLFARINDRQARRRCIAFVRATADGSDPNPAPTASAPA